MRFFRLCNNINDFLFRAKTSSVSGDIDHDMEINDIIKPCSPQLCFITGSFMNMWKKTHRPHNLRKNTLLSFLVSMALIYMISENLIHIALVVLRRKNTGIKRFPLFTSYITDKNKLKSVIKKSLLFKTRYNKFYSILRTTGNIFQSPQYNILDNGLAKQDATEFF